MKNKENKELNPLGQTFVEALEAMKVPTGLEAIKVSELIDVSSWREKQNKLVAENPFFEIVDNKTYEAGKKHRTNVVKGRTELVNQDKLVASNFATIRKEVGTETAALIEITQPLEDQWQKAVKDWEERKEREKKEAANAEALRVKTIKDKIEEIETSCYEIIQRMIFSEIDFSKTQLFAFFTVEFDFEEYDVLFDQVKSRVEIALDNKVESLTASENQRLDNIRLENDNAEAKRLSELQASRLNEILPYVAFGCPIDLTKLSEMDDDEYQGNLSSKKSLFEVDALSKKELQEQYEAKQAEEKDAIYEIRKQRFLEAGMKYSDEHDTFWLEEDAEYMLLAEEISDLAPLDFETLFNEVKAIISNAKLAVENAKIKEESDRKRELLFEEAGMPIADIEVLNFGLGDGTCFTVEKYQILDSTQEQFDNTLKLAKEAFFKHRSLCMELLGYEYNQEKDSFEMEGFLSYPGEMVLLKNTDFDYWFSAVEDQVRGVNERLAIEDAERLKKENKARIAKYAKDKKVLTEFIESLEFRNAVPELENEHSSECLDKLLVDLTELKKGWLNNINAI